MKHKNPYVGDSRTRLAKAKGFPARSVFKLEEIDARCTILRASMRVLDLGAAPGSWTLYAANRVGSRGLVVAVDLKSIGLTLPPNAIAFQGDALSQSEAPWTALAPFDVVMSDMAPSTSGSKIRDQTISFELFNCALASASRLGSKGSHFVAKLFMSDDFQAARSAAGKAYQTVRVLRPEGTRQNSSEVYIVGKHRRS